MKQTKKLILIALSILTLICLFVFGASAYNGTEYNNTGIYYEINNGKVTISDADKSIVTADIPSTINDYPVTSIGSYSFDGCSKLTSITIPDSVTSIGNSAFSGCSGLTSISLPFVGDKSHKSTDTFQYPFGYIFGTSSYTGGIGKEQSYYGSSTSSTTSNTYYIPSLLKTVKITGSSYIPYGAFYNCSNITSITIPNSVTSIGWCAFYRCRGLTSITIPNSVTSIGGSAFNGCSGLTSITIPNSVTSIGSWAFEDCTGLTSITIPNSVISIDWYAFRYCTGLTSIAIPNSVTGIGSEAFYGCTGLTGITIPDSVISIGSRAFCGCTGLTSVTIPESVTSIGSSAFRGCSSLTSISLPFIGDKPHKPTDKYQYPLGYIFGESYYNGGTSTIQSYYGSSASSTTNSTYYIPSSLKTVTITGSSGLPYGAFSGCTGLETITIKDKKCDISNGEIPKNIKIICLCESSALRYAKANGYSYEIKDGHTYKNVVTKATLIKDGKITPTCSVCKATKKATTIYMPKTFALTATKATYTGKAIKPSVTVTDSKGKAVASTNYTVSYKNNTNVGTATVTVTFKGNYSGTKSLTFKIVPAQVTGLKASTVKKDSIKLTWTKVTGAKYYKVEQSADGKKWTVIAKANSTNSLTVSKLKAGTKYQFRVTALDSTKKISGKTSAVLKTQTLCAAPTIKLTSSKSKTATVSWSKVTGATGYVVAYSKDNKTWTKKTVTGTSYTIKSLTGGKKVYVKVQATNSYKLNGGYSSVKNITVKK